MICKTCGRNTTNENANFCEYCGSSFRENGATFPEHNYGINQTISSNQAIQSQPEDKPISFVNWLLTMLIPFIPFVGFIAYPVLLLVWAFSNDTPPTKKNWARASLVIILIMVVLFVMMLSYGFNMIMSGEFSNYMEELYGIKEFY